MERTYYKDNNGNLWSVKSPFTKAELEEIGENVVQITEAEYNELCEQFTSSLEA